MPKPSPDLFGLARVSRSWGYTFELLLSLGSTGLVVLLQQLLDSEGEEGSQTKVQGFFTRLVLQDQDITRLHQRSRARIVDRFR